MLVHRVGRVGRVPEGEEVVGGGHAVIHESPCPWRGGGVSGGGRGGGASLRPGRGCVTPLPYARGLTGDKVRGGIQPFGRPGMGVIFLML